MRTPAAFAAHATSQIDQIGLKVDCERNCQHSNWTTSSPPDGDLNRRRSPTERTTRWIRPGRQSRHTGAHRKAGIAKPNTLSIPTTRSSTIPSRVNASEVERQLRRNVVDTLPRGITSPTPLAPPHGG